MLFCIYLCVPNFTRGVGNQSCSYRSPFPPANEHSSPTPSVAARPPLMKIWKYFSKAEMEAGTWEQIHLPGPAWPAASRWAGPQAAPAKPPAIHRPAKDVCNLERMFVIEIQIWKNLKIEKNWISWMEEVMPNHGSPGPERYLVISPIPLNS